MKKHGSDFHAILQEAKKDHDDVIVTIPDLMDKAQSMYSIVKNNSRVALGPLAWYFFTYFKA